MTPNWFIAFPMQVEGLRPMPDPPARVRLFDDADLHCTLAFLGSVDEADARRGWEAIDDAVLRGLVSGTFEEVRPLGNPRKPSALSAMVAEGANALSSMTVRLREGCLDASGARPDDRPPLPHMTLARVQRRASAAERRAAIDWARTLDVSNTSFSVTSLALYTWSTDRHTRLFQIVEQRSLRG